MWRHNLQNRQ